MAELLDRLSAVARPYLDIFPAATCIEQSRIVVEVLKRLDVANARAIETTLSVHCPELKFLYLAGATAEDRARGKRAVGGNNWIDHTTPEHEGHGHVVVLAYVEEGRYLIDATLAQASAPDRGMTIPRCVIPVGPLCEWPETGGQIVAGFDMEDGKKVEITWTFRDTRMFESTEAWEPSHLWNIINRIAREMKWAAVGERTKVNG